ncbi:hypothetical protein [Fluviicola sp.]|uniref:hypothetical protein n=1 Tax=Fluviicola sp. TaxID=1917219 RepID=UPI003D2E8E72
MKKVFFGCLFVTVLISCKKNHDCSCDYYTNGEKQTTNITPYKETKAKAKKKCEDMNSEGSFSFGGTTVQNETRCTLVN